MADRTAHEQSGKRMITACEVSDPQRRRQMISNQTFTSIAAALLSDSVTPVAETYNVDPAHTSITFSVTHLGIKTVKGQFKEFTGEIVMENGAIAAASGTIQMKSVDTGLQKRDAHL